MSLNQQRIVTLGVLQVRPNFCRIYFQNLNLAQVKEVIMAEIMEYHEEPKKQTQQSDKFNLKPVMTYPPGTAVRKQPSKEGSYWSVSFALG